MELSSIIKKLLLVNDRVEINGLGSFVANNKPAQLNADKGEIAPPSKEISFDDKNIKNDDLLKKAIMKQGLSEEDAQKSIDDFVKEVKSSLETYSKYEFKGLGVLHKDKKGLFNFVLDKNDALNVAAIGMKNVKISSEEQKAVKNPILSKNNKKDKQKKPKKDKQVVKAAVVKQPKEKKVVDKKQRAKTVKSMLIVLPIIALLVLLGLYHQPILEKTKSLFANNKQDTTQVVDNNQVDTTINQSSNNNSDFGNDVEYRKLLDANISNLAEVPLGNNYKKFYLVVNSYKERGYADNYAQLIRSQGYNPEVLNGTEYYRVSIGGYNTADNLIEDYNHYFDKFGGKIWILINR